MYEHSIPKEVLGPAETIASAIMSGALPLDSCKRDAIIAYHNGDAHAAACRFAAIVKVQSSQHDPGNSNVLDSLSQLSVALNVLGHTPQASALIQEVVNQRVRMLGHEHPDTLQSKCDLAILYRAAGDFNHSRALLEHAWTASCQVLGPNHPDTLFRKRGLAITLHALGDFAQAAALIEQVLRVQKQELGPEDSETLESEGDYATVLRAMGRLDEARSMHEHVVEACASSLGPEHLITILRQCNLAVLLTYMGDYAESARLLKHALVVQSQVLGEEHHDTISTQVDLASTLREMGDLARAKQLHEKAVAVRRHAVGPNHPDTLKAENELAATLHSFGDASGARALSERALRARVYALGPQHPHTLISMANYASLLRDKGELENAITMYERVVSVHEQSHGKFHAETSISRHYLATAQYKAGRYRKALALFEDVLVGLENSMGLNHPKTLDCQDYIVLCLASSGNHAEARQLCEYVQRSRVDKSGFDHPDSIRSTLSLALCTHADGDRNDAEHILSKYHIAAVAARTAVSGLSDRAVLGGSLGFQFASVMLSSWRLSLGRPSSEVFSPLASVTGRACLEVLERASVDLEAEVRSRLPDRAEEVSSALSSVQELHGQVRTLESRLEWMASRSVQLTREIESLRAAKLLTSERQAQLESHQAELAQHEAAMPTLRDDAQDRRRELADAQCIVLSIERELFPKARIPELAEVRSALQPGETMLVMGVAERVAVAMTIEGGAGASDDDEAGVTGFPVSDDAEALSLAESCVRLFSMGVYPDDRRVHEFMSALKTLDGHQDRFYESWPVLREACGLVVDLLEQRAAWKAEHPGEAVPAEMLDIPLLPSVALESLAKFALSVLFPPALRAALGSAECLLACPAGALLEVPLELLARYAGVGELLDKPVVYTPSPAVVVHTRGERTKQSRRGEGVASIGICFSDATEPAGSSGEADGGSADAPMAPSPSLSRSGSSVLDEMMVRSPGRHAELRCAEQEASEIAALFTAAGERASGLLGTQATLPAVREAVHGKGVRALHVASHGTLDMKHGMSSGVALWRSSDHGDLLLHDLLTTWRGALSECDVVTLSACETTRGVTLGDSVVSLPLGFLHAGARSVVATLWPVSDAAAWLVMRRFYENLLGQRADASDREDRPIWGGRVTGRPGEPMTVPAALEEARAWLRDVPGADELQRIRDAVDDPRASSVLDKLLARPVSLGELASPRHWAAFIIVGEPHHQAG